MVLCLKLKNSRVTLDKSVHLCGGYLLIAFWCLFLSFSNSLWFLSLMLCCTLLSQAAGVELILHLAPEVDSDCLKLACVSHSLREATVSRMGIQPNSGIDRGGNSFAGGLWALWKQASSLVRAG